MCGKGQPVDKSYIPKTPVNPDTNITTREMDEAERTCLDKKVCNAFEGIRYEELESDIRDALARLNLSLRR